MPETNTTAVAYFDFDGTLTTGDTFLPFLKWVKGPVGYWLKLLQASPYLVAYVLKLMANDKAKEAVLKVFLAGVQQAQLQRFGDTFAAEFIGTMLRPEGMQKLAWHQAQGHDCVLVSASFDIYLAQWAKAQGFSAYLTSSLQVESGAVTGALAGDNCFGEEKVRRIQTWLTQEAREPALSYAYGDTKGDLPMLRSVKQGYLWQQAEFKLI